MWLPCSFKFHRLQRRILPLTVKWRIQDTKYLQHEKYREKMCTHKHKLCMCALSLFLIIITHSLTSEGVGREEHWNLTFSLHILITFFFFLKKQHYSDLIGLDQFWNSLTGLTIKGSQGTWGYSSVVCCVWGPVLCLAYTKGFGPQQQM